MVVDCLFMLCQFELLVCLGGRQYSHFDLILEIKNNEELCEILSIVLVAGNFINMVRGSIRYTNVCLVSYTLEVQLDLC